MPLETLTGTDMQGLLALAQQRLGPEAMVLSARKTARGFELVATDTPPAEPARPASRPMDPALTSLRPRLAARAGREGRPPFILAAVGPTGAGKTTTLAKLATHPQVFGGVRTGLLCLDTYRVGALEQSAQYAEIARLPLQVVYEPADIRPALRRMEDCDVILVDTAGRGPGRGADIETTRTLLRQLRPNEVHLVLPAGMQRAAVQRLMNDYSVRGMTHVLATKLDEYPEENEIFSLARAAHLPMRWMTDGQDVPADLRSPADRLLNLPLPATARRAGAA